MKKTIVVSDFDGTITKKDTLYYFFKTYASDKWMEVEKLWEEGKIGSKECLTREFDLVENLNKELIKTYTKTIELDAYFKDFIAKIKKNNIDFIIVSDGIDYFINETLYNNGLYDIKTISNLAEFKTSTKITCPASYQGCLVNSGTCKCKVINDLKKEYEELIYIGDSTSDFCAAKNANIDRLFAKTKLVDFCIKNNIKYDKFNTFEDIINLIF